MTETNAPRLQPITPVTEKGDLPSLELVMTFDQLANAIARLEARLDELENNP